MRLQKGLTPCRSLSSLKSQLLPALEPLADVLPGSVPSRTTQVRLFELNEKENAPDPLRDIEAEDGAASRSLTALGWERWKTVFVR